MGLVNEIIGNTTGLKVPQAENPTVTVVLGVVNFPFPGIGTLIGGILEGSVANIIIGILQLVIPFAGWLWSWIWGAIMIMRGIKK